MINFILDFWYGKIKLWKSYWIIGELINSLVVFLIYNYPNRLNSKPIKPKTKIPRKIDPRVNPSTNLSFFVIS